jgi:hypothetical protein
LKNQEWSGVGLPKCTKTVSIFVVTQEFKLFQEIFLIQKDLPPSFTTDNNVTESTLKPYPGFSGHGSKLQIIILNVNI